MGSSIQEPPTGTGTGTDADSDTIEIVTRVFNTLWVLQESVLRDYLVFEHSRRALEPNAYDSEKQQGRVRAAKLLGEIEDDLRTMLVRPNPTLPADMPADAPVSAAGSGPAPSSTPTVQSGGGAGSFKCPHCKKPIRVSG